MAVIKKGKKIASSQWQDGREKRNVFHVVKLGSAHGIQGGLKYHLLGHFVPEPNTVYEMLLLDREEKFIEKVEVEFLGQGKSAFCYVDCIENRTEAEKHTHHLLAFLREDMPSLPQGLYYVEDLIGMRVRSQKQGWMGKIKELLTSSAQDVYVVDRSFLGKRDLLFVDDHQTIKSVDLEAGEMEVQLAEGLWEVYED